MKKGFTLIELLGVIVVLGVIGAIVAPAIQGSLRDSAVEACKMQIKSFEKAARNYANQNPFSSHSCVSLSDLQGAGFLREGTLSNPNGGSFNSDWKVSMSGNTYKFNYNCTTNVYTAPSC